MLPVVTTVQFAIRKADYKVTSYMQFCYFTEYGDYGFLLFRQSKLRT